MNGKVLVSAVSLILVVGVALGVVAVVSYKKDNEGQVTTHNKDVDVICQGTDDKKLCRDTLSPLNTTDPKDYIKAVVQSTMDSVIKSLNMSDRLSVEHGNSTNGVKMAIDDCKDLLESAIDELEASGVMVKENNLRNVSERADDLKNWLGAVIAYQQSCLDGFETDLSREKNVQSELQTGGLDNVQKLTGLALDVVTAISRVLAAFDLNLNVKPASRRLLHEVDHEGYPSWFSGADRKLLTNVNGVTPKVVVAKDGSGQFKTVLEAINSYPKNHLGRYVIYVKAGVYDEYISVGKKMRNIFIYGDGPTKTIITGRKNFREGVKTMRTATFATVAEDFVAKSMAFENTAGSIGHQAVALRVQGDRSAFFDVAIRGYQDTLYAHAKRQFYRNCEISGTIDFIFGYSTTLIQNSKIIVRKPDSNQQNIVVADGTIQKNMPTGVVLQNCEIVPDTDLFPERLTVRTYLARPWKAFSKAIFIENVIGDLIQPEGFLPWAGTLYLDTCYFAEFANTGPGAAVNRRVPWGRGLLNKNDAALYTAEQWLHASKWLPATSVPFNVGFTKA